MTWFTWPVCVFLCVLTVCVSAAAAFVLLAAGLGKERLRLDAERKAAEAAEQVSVQQILQEAEATLARATNVASGDEAQSTDAPEATS